MKPRNCVRIKLRGPTLRLSNKIIQIKAERNISEQLVFMPVFFPLCPVTWSLATADRMPVETDKSKFMHHLETEIGVRTNVP